ncbi:FecR family protein [Marinifilum sp. JC070]|uniref:FecR family protein n=2 Tax=Marinifilum caeruleilacunae TaxID=2499076 RepID=A0ABX1WTL6_9BACT|nr:FecR family protein [Marinifilum caeruleilacunae]
MTEMTKINQLIAKHFAGDISNEEMSQLKEWLDSSEDNRLLFNDLKQSWESFNLPASSEDKFRVLSKVKARIKTDEIKEDKVVRPLFNKVWYKYAASLIVIVSVSILAWYQLNEPFSVLNTLGYEVNQCEAGTHEKLILSDGSQVFMNGDSRIKYKMNAEGSERIVYLEGEAFFDVARDEKKPFIIGLDDAEVKVLGTSFNIKAYPGDHSVETSVVTGKVAFNHMHGFLKKNKESMFLVPGQKGVINHSSDSFDQLSVNNELDIAWMQKKLNFKNTPLLEITKQLYRMYGVKFKLTDGSLEDLKITASFENEKLEEVMKILEMMSEFSYKQENNLLTIGKKGEF